MFKYTKVRLASGFIGFAPSDRFFIRGSIVKAFSEAPISIKRFGNIYREVGVVVEFLD